METKKHGKELVVEDGHPASFRNADGSMKNIYADDGNLTEEGKTVMLLRETLSKETHNDEKTDKERKRNRKLIGWAVSAIAIVFFLLFFHIYISNTGGFDVFAKSSPTFSHTFITQQDAKAVIERINNASSLAEQTSIRNEAFVKRLYDRGILYTIEDYNEEDYYLSAEGKMIRKDKWEKPQSNPVNEEQTEYYKYYLYGESGGEWKTLDVKIIFGKKDIKVVYSEGASTFVIVGKPKYDKDENCTTYSVYYIDNADKDIIEITRYKDRTHIQYIPESGEYEIFTKNKPEYY